MKLLPFSLLQLLLPKFLSLSSLQVNGYHSSINLPLDPWFGMWSRWLWNIIARYTEKSIAFFRFQFLVHYILDRHIIICIPFDSHWEQVTTFLKIIWPWSCCCICRADPFWLHYVNSIHLSLTSAYTMNFSRESVPRSVSVCNSWAFNEWLTCRVELWSYSLVHLSTCTTLSRCSTMIAFETNTHIGWSCNVFKIC